MKKNKAKTTTTCSEILIRDYINLPKPSDKGIWDDLDKQLYKDLPLQMAGSTPGEQLDNLEDHIYKVLVTTFGVKAERHKVARKVKPSHHQRKLRLLKKQAKQAFKKALKNGDRATTTALKQDFHKLVRIHNKVRKLELEKRQKQSRSINYARFRRNPYQFAKALFSDKVERSPTFSKTVAEKFFVTTYFDKNREYKYHPIHGLKRPPAPLIPFNVKPPTLSELKDYLHRRRNACAPGTNRIPFLVWKKCPLTVTLLHDVLCKIWKGSSIPLSWRVGETILISKTEDTTSPANFRPITLKNSSGNLFMGILAQRCIRFLTDNKYIDTSLQKGFMEKMAGCIEHTEALTEILQNARKSGKPVTTSWLDLQNAYGSVPHNLIQYALEWYYVPDPIRKIVFNYYDESYIRVKTNNWTTTWIHCGIGVFQGCPLSCTLFTAVFNLCLDLLQKQANLGFHLPGTSITTSTMAYADDLTLISKNPTDCQKLIDVVDTFLRWTRTMKAKPSKCKSLAMKKTALPINGKQKGLHIKYSPYDPLLKINGANIAYINSEPMKFLGKLMYKDLKDDDIRMRVRQKLSGMLKTTDQCQLNGPMKMWIYNNAIVPRLTWELTIYNFPMTYIESLETTCTKFLKKWAGICKSISTSALYRSRNKFGLQLKKLSTTAKCMQATKYHLNKYSTSTTTKKMYSESMQNKQKLSRWNGVKELENRERHLLINEICRGQHDRAGLGLRRNQKRISAMLPNEHRKSITNLIKEVDEEDMITYLYSCAKQGQFLKWDTAMQVDTSWNKLLYIWSPELLSFHINAVHDLLPSPANLRLWGKTDTGKCELCHHNNCTLFHILNNCNFSLHDGRYNWRHDQTLITIRQGLLPFITMANSRTNQDCLNKDHIVKAPKFKSATGSSYYNPELHFAIDTAKDILSRANDWVITMDEEFNQVAFPVQILETSKRPDITIYSQRTQTVVIIELTVPLEENLESAHARKKCKYDQLVAECESRGWKTHYFPVEIGSRGFYNISMTKCLTALGIPRGSRKPILDNASRTALRASYFIWLNRKNHHFERCNLTGTEGREEGRLSAPKTGLTHRRLVRSPETSPVIQNCDAADDVQLESSATTDDSSKVERAEVLSGSSATSTTDDSPNVERAEVLSVATLTVKGAEVPNGHMRKLLIPCDLSHQFSRAARSNTNSDIETCGILLGKLIANCLHITHLLIPKQKGTPNSCSAEKEEEVTEYQLSNAKLLSHSSRGREGKFFSCMAQKGFHSI